MIDGKVLKFGYGDIAVGGYSLTQRIRFQQFKPPGKCGENVPENIEYIGEEIILQISYDEYCEFNECLDFVLSKEITTFEFKGYVFDFTNYSEQSVMACKSEAGKAMYSYFLCMAA